MLSPARLIVFLLLAWLQGWPAQAGERVALVIGNGQYRHAPALANPVNDAADVAGRLASLGFTVVEGHDVDKAAFEQRIRQFADILPGAREAVFFYAGHGVQVDGENYLVPVDSRLESETALDFETIRLSLALKLMERQAATSIVFLDACRNNPFVNNLARSMGTRSTAVGRGLAKVESGVGSFVAFSTQPGNIALDGSGRNSPFTAALLQAIELPGLGISDLMISVRRAVIEATNGQQVPWEHSSLTGTFYFIPLSGEDRQKIVSIAPFAKQEQLVGRVESFIRDSYLNPFLGDMNTYTRANYADQVEYYAKRMGWQDVAREKAKWFSRWQAFAVTLVPGTVKADPTASGEVKTEFDVNYRWVGHGGNPVLEGVAKVNLTLVPHSESFKISGETSYPIR